MRYRGFIPENREKTRKNKDLSGKIPRQSSFVIS